MGKGFDEKLDFIIFPLIFLKLLQINLIRGQYYHLYSVKVKQLTFRIDGVFLSKNVK
ncbi:hypothetical protein ETSB_1273 [cyanobacterium endosymbiont of Epithemia turgida isolate EtSB Lake Yunoko]|nr:hypothetical protein ETSB_1273 [cyanobacterium endosymbiont of Epithemia turgida isolate EtSB Lake Yunoko]